MRASDIRGTPTGRMGPSSFGAAAFAVFLCVGCGFIVGAKLLGWPAAIVTFTPVAIMAGYAILLWFAKGMRLRDDQAGDNIYYMGFLFTLTSLGVALYQFSAAGSAEDIVRNFGIAVASTIAGVAGRVLFNQMRQDPVEVEHTARLELSEAARRVRRELDSTLLDFAGFRRATVQILDEATRETAGSLTKASESLAGSLVESGVRTTEALDRHTRTLTKALAATASDLETQSARISQSALEAAEALEAVVANLNRTPMPEEMIAGSIAPSVDALREVVQEFSRQSKGATLNVARSISTLRQELAGHAAVFRDGVGTAVQPAAARDVPPGGTPDLFAGIEENPGPEPASERDGAEARPLTTPVT